MVEGRICRPRCLEFGADLGWTPRAIRREWASPLARSATARLFRRDEEAEVRQGGLSCRPCAATRPTGRGVPGRADRVDGPRGTGRPLARATRVRRGEW